VNHLRVYGYALCMDMHSVWIQYGGFKVYHGTSKHPPKTPRRGPIKQAMEPVSRWVSVRRSGIMPSSLEALDAVEVR